MRTAAANSRTTNEPVPAQRSGNGAITFLTIPTPPSTNHLFANVQGRGRVKTGGYKQWLDHAGWVLRSQSPEPVAGRVMVVLGIERDSAASDIDNRVKAIFDLLVTHKVIKDDKLVTAFAIAWSPKGTGQARVAIMPAVDMTVDFILNADGASGGWFIRSPEQEPATYGD